jgi:hypothetical protein
VKSVRESRGEGVGEGGERDQESSEELGELEIEQTLLDHETVRCSPTLTRQG